MAKLPPTPPTQGKAQTQERRPQTARYSLRAAYAYVAAPRLGPQNSHLALIYKATVEKLNEQLLPELGANALQNGMSAGFNFTPVATAEHIVSQSTRFYDTFKERHQGKNSADVLIRFMQIISNGIEQGFKEAANILNGLRTLNGDVAGSIEQTYNLVQFGLQAFHEENGKDLPPPTVDQGKLHPDWSEELGDIKLGK